MKYVIDHDLHIHSKLSPCSNDPMQTKERILQYAKQYGLKTICVTDHFWDASIPCTNRWYRGQNFGHIDSINPLPRAEDIRFLFGCETDMDYTMQIGIAPEIIPKLDFVIIPTTHFHMRGFSIPEDVTTPAEKAEFWIRKLDAVLNMNLPFSKIGLAHLTCYLIDQSRENYLRTLEFLDEAKLHVLFAKAAWKKVGIEINSFDMKFPQAEQETVLRIYKIAKEEGCKFYLGSDAHHPQDLVDAIPLFQKAVDLLELTEYDKFRLDI